ncbi:subunit Sec63 of preprotein translocase [Hamiltosporidium tvaerminnensis]|uniref:Subunit Sec63 of preprotein translocase n=1 Tax=Hamiltosporidium tvaerminnensis TaxID=1176355 RepID=A0A4Q9M0N5_9MICR|nr:subunit Sec63 of preprotein translocase [Hamiltosporidium tvaerminnensis]
MSHNYEYDDSGLASSYLFLSILLPITLYKIYKYFTLKSKVLEFPCVCDFCTKKVRRKRFGINSLIFLIPIVCILLKNIFTIKMERKSSIFNPYEVLGLQEEASKREIKKAFRKMNKKYDDVFAPEGSKEEYKNKKVEIGKAYNVLKDGKGFQKMIEEEIDAKGNEIVAIPKWIINQGYVMLILYAIILGLVFPRWAVSKWKKNIERNKLGVYYTTMEYLYGKISSDLVSGTSEYSTVRNLINILTETREFKERKWKTKNISEIKNLIEYKFGVPLKDDKKACDGYFILCDHLFRTGKSETQDIEYIQRTTISLLNAMKKICFARNLESVLKNIFVFEKMVVQAIFDPEYWMMQYPHVKFENILLGGKIVGKGNVYENTEEFLKSILEEADLKVDLELFKKLPKIYFKNINCGVKSTGHVEEEASDVDENSFNNENMSNMSLLESGLNSGTSSVSFDIKSDELKRKKKEIKIFKIEENALVSLNIKLDKILEDNEKIKIKSIGLGEEDPGYILQQEGEMDVKLYNSIGNYKEQACHAPFLTFRRLCRWTVYIIIDGKIYNEVSSFYDFEGEKKLLWEFDGKNAGSSSQIRICIMNDTYFGGDMCEEICLKYV